MADASSGAVSGPYGIPDHGAQRGRNRDAAQPVRENELVPLPSVSDVQLQLVLVIYRLFERANDWPTLEFVDYEFDGLGHPDAVQVLRSMPPAVINGLEHGAAPSPAEGCH
ncbi:hypothetical protein [uncultured Nocardioides sp.]|uniref:hypothetical protein n=1 Tax=uncultured Nocardioides sp. TaxID=198441 RepID=UPI0026217FA6|nr:hypothetical protein [uncultured Nocardioides sp.]